MSCVCPWHVVREHRRYFNCHMHIMSSRIRFVCPRGSFCGKLYSVWRWHMVTHRSFIVLQVRCWNVLQRCNGNVCWQLYFVSDWVLVFDIWSFFQ